MHHVQSTFAVTERHALHVLGQTRSTQRYSPIIRDNEVPLTAAIVSLAGQYGRYGYCRLTALLRAEGWHGNRVARIRRLEGLKVTFKQPKRGRLCLNDGSRIRLRPSWQHHVWAYDLLQARTYDGRAFPDADVDQ